MHREWEFDFCIFLDTGDMEGGKGEIFFVENGEVIMREQFDSCLSLFVNPRILPYSHCSPSTPSKDGVEGSSENMEFPGVLKK